MRVQLNPRVINDLTRDMSMAQDAIDRAIYRGINKVANKAFTRGRSEISSQVNLSASYVRDRMDMSPASPGRFVAVISARMRNTTLSTYGARQATRKAKRAKGDARRGIAAGSKQAGISVAVKRGGGRKRMPGAFLIPLRAGKDDGGNGMGVFIREGGMAHAQSIVSPEIRVGKNRWKKGTPLNRVKSRVTGSAGVLRHLYGPSVYQVFRQVIADIAPDMPAELETAISSQLDYELKKVKL